MFFSKETTNKTAAWKEDFSKYFLFYASLVILVCGFPRLDRFFNYTIVFYIIAFTEFLYNFRKDLRIMPVIKTLVLIGNIFFIYKFYFEYFPYNEKYRYDMYIPYTSIFDESVDNSYRESMHEETLIWIEKSERNSRDY